MKTATTTPHIVVPNPYVKLTLNKSQTDAYVQLTDMYRAFENELMDNPDLTEDEIYKITKEMDDLYDIISELNPDRTYLANLSQAGLI